VLKAKLIPLIVTLRGMQKASEGLHHRSWYQLLIAYRQEGSMKSQATSRRKSRNLREEAPILYSVLTASFMPCSRWNHRAGNRDRMASACSSTAASFPTAELLMLDRQELPDGHPLSSSFGTPYP
jgi:hypothetical protein